MLIGLRRCGEQQRASALLRQPHLEQEYVPSRIGVHGAKGERLKVEASGAGDDAARTRILGVHGRLDERRP